MSGPALVPLFNVNVGDVLVYEYNYTHSHMSSPISTVINYRDSLVVISKSSSPGGLVVDFDRYKDHSYVGTVGYTVSGSDVISRNFPQMENFSWSSLYHGDPEVHFGASRKIYGNGMHAAGGNRRYAEGLGMISFGRYQAGTGHTYTTSYSLKAFYPI